MFSFIASHPGASVPFFLAWLSTFVLVGRIMIPSIPDWLVWSAATIFFTGTAFGSWRLAVLLNKLTKEYDENSLKRVNGAIG